MKNLKRMRLLCGLRQQDLSAATGVPIYRISGAETGRLALTARENGLLTAFLRERWSSIQELETNASAAIENAEALQ